MYETAKAAQKVENRYPFTRHFLPQMSMCVLYGLGIGGNGTVYLAEECTTRWDCDGDCVPPKRYALKVIEKRFYDRAQMHLITREYKYHTRVASHPNILQPHSMLDTKDAVIFTSEYIRDGDFHRFLCKYGHFLCRDNALIKTIFLQLLDAVAHMHEQGVYHGDLKPENILCKHEADSSRVLIADFGACTDRPYIYHQNGYTIGTEEYISPECLPGPSGGQCVFPHAIDIWSLGLILFIMCTGGQLPWKCAHADLDPYYHAFIANPKYFFSRWSLSRSTQALLNIIWQPRPEARVNIYQLREMVESITEFTTYADSSQAIICAKRHAVLHTQFWLAGRCGLPRENDMPRQHALLRKLDIQVSPPKVKRPPSTKVPKVPKFLTFHGIVACFQRLRWRLVLGKKKPKPLPTAAAAPQVAATTIKFN